LQTSAWSVPIANNSASRQAKRKVKSPPRARSLAMIVAKLKPNSSAKIAKALPANTANTASNQKPGRGSSQCSSKRSTQWTRNRPSSA